MTVTLTPEDALAQIPGWEHAKCTPLEGGLTNSVWHVSAGGRAAVLKIDAERRCELFGTRCEEAFVQNRAAQAGLAPSVILADARIYLTEFVEGDVWTRKCFYRQENLQRIAAALKRLHALPLTGRCFDASLAAKIYQERASGLNADTIETCTGIISRMGRPHHLCCCHNDLVAENIVAAPELMFLDWEYACDNDPFFDMATIVEHHELDDAQVTELLEAYFGSAQWRWRKNLEEQRKLYLALLCLWMSAQPDSDSLALQRIVMRLPTSCS